jgi:hypothetical protein
MKDTKPKTTRETALDAVEELIAYSQSKRGRIAEILRRFNAMIATPVRRQVFERWLKQDRANRVEPMLGAGLILLRVFEDLKQTDAFIGWKGAK